MTFKSASTFTTNENVLLSLYLSDNSFSFSANFFAIIRNTKYYVELSFFMNFLDFKIKWKQVYEKTIYLKCTYVCKISTSTFISIYAYLERFFSMYIKKIYVL